MTTVNNRWQAFGVHLAISAIIFLALFCVIYFIWYPGAFIHFGGIEGIKIIAGVDLVLGPLLTLIVFNRAKKSLGFDLTLIGLIQIACLCFGTYFVYNERPTLQVISYNGLHIAAASQLSMYDLEQTNVNTVKANGLPQTFLTIPKKEQSLAMHETDSWLDHGRPLVFREELYTQPETISKDEFDQRIDSLGFKENGCLAIKLYSPHVEKSACITISDENTVLINSLLN